MAPLPTRSARLPVIVCTSLLGAGKTTVRNLLLRLAACGYRTIREQVRSARASLR